MIIVFCFAIIPFPVSAQKSDVFFREDFNDLTQWEPLYFKKISKHSEYSVESNGIEQYLKAESSASASGIISRTEFNVFDCPRLRWRWKISNVYQKGNALRKEGDDYPGRVYVIFQYDPGKASYAKRVKYGLAKRMNGEYPPHSSLNYIWANREHTDDVLTNTYAQNAKMILLREGSDSAGIWIEEDVNILEDYRRAFHEDPPATARLAIMNDSDNTGESAVSYIDYIEVYR
ncbi:MAG: DUF3047 domain-containing protein [Nitrospiraceae bacterium]|nr:MAG: DUF3047 domain-containing protein [Nitrospiraceae bacterium]UCH45669.1 MAG: DUF3047 domain-containing protein [Nitrospiraceae bacterium]